MTHPVPAQPVRRRPIGRWIAICLALLLVPMMVVAVGVLSMLTLSRDATVLRREVTAATNAKWQTKVQVSAGWLVLGAVRTGLGFVDHEHMDDARDAMAAVRNVSVGVYERVGRAEKWSREQLLRKTDERMRERGWNRLVGVNDHGQTVLVYTSDATDVGDRMDLCVAVVEGNNLVIVSAKIDADGLVRLADKHLPEGRLRERLAKL